MDKNMRIITVSEDQIAALHAVLRKGREEIKAATTFFESSPEFIGKGLSAREKIIIEMFVTQLISMTMVITSVIALLDAAQEGTVQ